MRRPTYSIGTLTAAVKTVAPQVKTATPVPMMNNRPKRSENRPARKAPTIPPTMNRMTMLPCCWAFGLCCGSHQASDDGIDRVHSHLRNSHWTGAKQRNWILRTGRICLAVSSVVLDALVLKSDSPKKCSTDRCIYCYELEVFGGAASVDLRTIWHIHGLICFEKDSLCT